MALALAVLAFGAWVSAAQVSALSGQGADSVRVASGCAGFVALVGLAASWGGFPAFVIPAIGADLVVCAAWYLDWAADWDKHGNLARVAVVVVGFGLLYVVPRYLHLLSVAVSAVNRHRGASAAFPPLPSQQPVVDDLVRACTDVDSRSGFIIALRARWGAGKTECLRAFCRKMREQRSPVIWFDCWRHQTDVQPEFAIYWEMARSWPLMWPFGWLVVPAIRMYASQLPVLLKVSFKLPGGSSVELDDKAFRELPKPLFWQRHLESLVNLGSLRNRRVALVLEDIDRCSALAAQRYVLLTRRFLSVPGLTVIIPHVEAQLRHKVFDPLSGQLPDLAATSAAVLEQWFGERLAGGGDLAAEAKFKLALEATDRPAGAEGSASVRTLLRPLMMQSFLAAPLAEREKIFNLFEDKYLADQVVVVPDMTAEDVATLILSEVRHSATWCEILGGDLDPTRNPLLHQETLSHLRRHLDEVAMPRMRDPASVLGRPASVVTRQDTLLLTPRQVVRSAGLALRESSETISSQVDGLALISVPGTPRRVLARYLLSFYSGVILDTAEQRTGLGGMTKWA